MRRQRLNQTDESRRRFTPLVVLRLQDTASSAPARSDLALWAVALALFLLGSVRLAVTCSNGGLLVTAGQAAPAISFATGRIPRGRRAKQVLLQLGVCT
jgi:hypothetical protein